MTNRFFLFSFLSFYVLLSTNNFIFGSQSSDLKNKSKIFSPNVSKNKNVLMLVSCWPPGRDIKRIAVEAELNKI